MALYALLMAGGTGERLWPLSRKDRPKQFAPFLPGGKSLFQESYRRACSAFGSDKVYVVTNASQEQLVLDSAGISRDQLIVEPERRNTGPCLVLGALTLLRADQDAVAVALPSDHHVGNEGEYLRALGTVGAIAQRTTSIATIGVKPTRPETEYGYLLVGESVPIDDVFSDPRAFHVEAFVEKPTEDEAIEMIDAGSYYWNCGIFGFRCKEFMRSYCRHMPNDRDTVFELRSLILDKGLPSKDVGSVFGRLTKISIDYAVMEKSNNIVMVEGIFGWDDMGSWNSVSRLYGRDNHGNTIVGHEVVVKDCQNTVLFQDEGNMDRCIAVFGIKDMVVVDAGSVTMVASNDAVSHLKQYLMDQDIEAPTEGKTPVLGIQPTSGHFVKKPWGIEIWWAQTDSYLGKWISVRAGHSLSRQYHRFKTETLLFVEGLGTVEIDGTEMKITPGLVIHIPKSTIHRVNAVTPLVFVEISTPESDDVVRLEDDYGRV